MNLISSLSFLSFGSSEPNFQPEDDDNTIHVYVGDGDTIADQTLAFFLSEKRVTDLSMTHVRTDHPDLLQYSLGYAKMDPTLTPPCVVWKGEPVHSLKSSLEFLDDCISGMSFKPVGQSRIMSMQVWVELLNSFPIDEYSLAQVCRSAGARLVVEYLISQEMKVLQSRLKLCTENEEHSLCDAYSAKIAEWNDRIERIGDRNFARKCQTQIDGILRSMQQSLTETGDWLCGEMFSLADIYAIPFLSRLEVLARVNFSEYPLVVQYMERAKKRESYQVLTEFYGRSRSKWYNIRRVLRMVWHHPKVRFGTSILVVLLLLLFIYLLYTRIYRWMQ